MSDNINIKKYLGVNIKDICENEYDNNDDNQCAHAVGHLLGFSFGYTCFDQKGKGLKETEAPIRVNEIFDKCSGVGTWTNKPVTLSFCLAFVIDKRRVNLTSGTMENIPRKHIGIYHGGYIYHYSNTNNKIVRTSPNSFKYHYSGPNIAVFYAEIPKNEVGKNWLLVP